MPCYTRIEVELDDDQFTRKARENLGVALEGRLPRDVARRVKAEASVLKAYASVKKLDPRAVIRRKGNKLVVNVRR